MTETLTKLDEEKVEVRTTIPDRVMVWDRKNILSEIAECEETIARNRRWLAQLD